MKQLNLGCGNRREPGFLNLDERKIEGVEILGKAEELPFKRSSFSRVRMTHVLEHCEFRETLEEVWRVLSPGGSLEVTVPHVSSIGAWSDPTHKRAFTCRTWEYLEEGNYNLPRFHVERLQVSWRAGRFSFLDLLFNWKPRFFEKYFAPLLGGFQEIRVLLTKKAFSC